MCSAGHDPTPSAGRLCTPHCQRGVASLLAGGMGTRWGTGTGTNTHTTAAPNSIESGPVIRDPAPIITQKSPRFERAGAPLVTTWRVYTLNWVVVIPTTGAVRPPLGCVPVAPGAACPANTAWVRLAARLQCSGLRAHYTHLCRCCADRGPTIPPAAFGGASSWLEAARVWVQYR